MSDVGDLWRAVKDGVREHRNTMEGYRWARVHLLLQTGEVVARRRVGEYGIRLAHKDWPKGRSVDYWPRTGTFMRTTNRRNTGRGWHPLLKALEMRDWWDGVTERPLRPKSSQ